MNHTQRVAEQYLCVAGLHKKKSREKFHLANDASVWPTLAAEDPALATRREYEKPSRDPGVAPAPAFLDPGIQLSSAVREKGLQELRTGPDGPRPVLLSC